MVTGAAGFIGSHVVTGLAAQGVTWSVSTTATPRRSRADALSHLRTGWRRRAGLRGAVGRDPEGRPLSLDPPTWLGVKVAYPRKMPPGQGR